MSRRKRDEIWFLTQGWSTVVGPSGDKRGGLKISRKVILSNWSKKGGFVLDIQFAKNCLKIQKMEKFQNKNLECLKIFRTQKEIPSRFRQSLYIYDFSQLLICDKLGGCFRLE